MGAGGRVGGGGVERRSQQRAQGLKGSVPSGIAGNRQSTWLSFCARSTIQMCL